MNFVLDEERTSKMTINTHPLFCVVYLYEVMFSPLMII